MMIPSAAMRLGYLVVIVLFLLPSIAAADEIIIDPNVTGTVTIPDGDFARLNGTYTLDGALIDVFGLLSSGSGTVVMTGTGEVMLNEPSGRWSYGCCGTNSVTIDSGITVLGQRGTRYASKGTVNQGTFAAIDGGSTLSGFTILASHGFVNEGILEARDGGELRIQTATPATFGIGSLLRAQPGGTLQVSGSTITSLADLGTVENLGGTIELYGADLDNAGQTMNLIGGEWKLLSSTEINGGTVQTTAGGSLSIQSIGSFSFQQSNPVEFHDVTLASDLRVESGGRFEVFQELTLDNANLNFQGGTKYLYLSAAAPVSGTGTIVAEGTGTTRIEASGGTVIMGPGVDLQAAPGNISLLQRSGLSSATYDVAGDIMASQGTFTQSVELTSRGQATALNGGKLAVLETWNNLGTMQIGPGGNLQLSGTLNNEGSLVVNNGNILYAGGSITGPGTTTFSGVRVLATGSTTLTPYLAVGDANVGRGVYNGELDLEGQTITLGTQPGGQWILSDGTLHNGTVNSTGGAELSIEIPVGLLGKQRATLYDLELNADIRVGADQTLNVTGPLTGTGQLMIDGGTLLIGGGQSDSYARAAIERVLPNSGVVQLSGPIDNVGETILLKSGVEWQGSHGRSDLFIGGRIEGETGVELTITSGYAFANTGWATFRDNVTLALPLVIPNNSSDGRATSVLDGLTLENTHIMLGTGEGGQFDHARIQFQGASVLAGSGEVRFGSINGFPSDPTYPRINMIQVVDSTTSPGSLTIAPGITVRTSTGSGYLGGDYFYQLPPERVPLVNQGKLLAENGHTLTVFASDFEQTGTLQTDEDSTLRVETDDFENDGLLKSTGGQFAFTGNWTQSSTAGLEVSLDGVNASALVDVTGVANLAGLLEIEFSGGFMPVAGENFPLINASSVQGNFDTVTLPSIAAEVMLFLNFTANTVELVATFGADFDRDLDVDGADLLAIQREAPSLISLWQMQNGGDARALAASQQVPESTSLVLSLIGFAATLSLRRRACA